MGASEWKGRGKPPNGLKAKWVEEEGEEEITSVFTVELLITVIVIMSIMTMMCHVEVTYHLHISLIYIRITTII